MAKKPLSPSELAQQLGGAIPQLEAIYLLAIEHGTEPDKRGMVEFTLTPPLFQKAIQEVGLPTKRRATGQLMQFVQTDVLAAFHDSNKNRQPLRPSTVRKKLERNEPMLIRLYPASIDALIEVARDEGIGPFAFHR